MRRGGIVALACLGALLAAPATRADVKGYDGSIPFQCALQQAGFGTSYQDPGADPFCVEYDKRRQNVTQLGVVEFLAQEPARVAAASGKCFYFQRDHWRGSIVQDQEATETYNWDGSYFYDLARGLGGVYVENFTVNNQTGDPRQLPGFPEAWKPFFGPGRGGIQTTDTVKVDPRCQARTGGRPGAPAGAPSPDCIDPVGELTNGVAGARLGMSPAAVEEVLGPAGRRRAEFFHFCLRDGRKLAVGFARHRAALFLTTSPGFDVQGVRPGIGARSARRRLRGERRLLRRGRSTVLSVPGTGARRLVGLRRGRVSYLGVSTTSMRPRSLSRALGRSR